MTTAENGSLPNSSVPVTIATTVPTLNLPRCDAQMTTLNRAIR